MTIAESLSRVREEIAEACRRAGRDVAGITLVGVTKTFPASVIREAAQAGLRDVGENRVQEILAKRPELLDCPLTWHMIGSLQTNKVKGLLPHLGVLHSLDRASLVTEFDRAPADTPIPALIQVNTTGETTKSGVRPDEVEPLLVAALASSRLRVHGFMTIGPWGGTEDDNRRAFSKLRELRERMAARFPEAGLPWLSMGMSDDFPVAIQEGATHVRIGSRIFGVRPPLRS